jgi:hypothetical protein
MFTVVEDQGVRLLVKPLQSSVHNNITTVTVVVAYDSDTVSIGKSVDGINLNTGSCAACDVPPDIACVVNDFTIPDVNPMMMVAKTADFKMVTGIQAIVSASTASATTVSSAHLLAPNSEKSEYCSDDVNFTFLFCIATVPSSHPNRRNGEPAMSHG